MIYFKRFSFLVFIVFFFFTDIIAQNQKEADSLINVYQKNQNLSDSLATKILYLITVKSSEPSQISTYADILIEKSKSYRPIYYAIQVNNVKGVAYRMQGDLDNAVNYLFKSVELATENNYPVLAAEAYGEIANTYISHEDYNNALEYQNKAINILRKEKIYKRLCIALLNAGFNYYSVGQLEDALLHYNEAEPIFDSLEITIGKAYTIGNRALVYWKQGNVTQATEDLNQAILMLKPMDDKFGMADYHNQLASIYLEQNRLKLAAFHAQQSTKMAKELGLKEQLRDGYLLLSELYAKQDDHKQAFNYQNQYVVYKDSLDNAAQTKKIANLRTDFEVSLREKEIENLKKKEALNTTYSIIGAILLALSIVVLLYLRQRLKTSRLIQAQEQQQHSNKIKTLMQVQETKVLQSMIEGRDNERKRLAQELHNHLGSLLATIKVNINGIEETAIQNHKTLTQLVDQACNDVRNMSHTLNMGVSEDFGLIPALKELIQNLKQTNTLDVEFSASMCDGILNSDIEIVSYRIIQELISNALKHANATKLSVQLTCFEEDDLMNILVQDNGNGFNTNVDYKGIGLKGIKKMVAQYNGDIVFDSNTISGTTANIDIPLSKIVT